LATVAVREAQNPTPKTADREPPHWHAAEIDAASAGSWLNKNVPVKPISTNGASDDQSTLRCSCGGKVAKTV